MQTRINIETAMSLRLLWWLYPVIILFNNYLATTRHSELITKTLIVTKDCWLVYMKCFMMVKIKLFEDGLQNRGSSKFRKFHRKYLCWSLFLIKLQAFRPVTLFKKDSNTSVLLWIWEILKKTFFYWTPLVATSINIPLH